MAAGLRQVGAHGSGQGGVQLVALGSKLFVQRSQRGLVLLTQYISGLYTIGHQLGAVIFEVADLSRSLADSCGLGLGHLAVQYARAMGLRVVAIDVDDAKLALATRLGAEVATCLNISEDHMDRYSGLPAYHLAKHRIFRGAQQVVVNRDDGLSRPLVADQLPCWTFGLGKPDFKGFGLTEREGEKWLTFQFEPLLPTGWRVTSIISNLLIILGGVIILRNQAFSTATLTTMVVIVAGFGWIVEGVMSILESELSSNRALAILSGALSIIAGMFVFIYPLWSAKMLVIFSGAALLVFGVTLIVRAIQFGKLVH